MAITGKTASGRNIHDNRFIEVLPAVGKRPGTYRDVSQSLALFKHRKRLADKKAKLIGVDVPEDVQEPIVQLVSVEEEMPKLIGTSTPGSSY